MSKEYLLDQWMLTQSDIKLAASDEEKHNALSYGKHIFDFASSIYGFEWASKNLLPM